jgi:hypothetical protein
MEYIENGSMYSQLSIYHSNESAVPLCLSEYVMVIHLADVLR